MSSESMGSAAAGSADGDIEVCVVGSIGRDLLFPVETLPRAGQTVLSADLTTAIGGKGSNQAAAAARLGRRTVLLARVGADDSADLVADLARSGVLTSGCLATPGTPSQHAVLLVAPDGENMIAVSQGASALLSPRDVEEHAELIQSARVVLLQQEIPPETVAAAVRVARAGAGDRRPITILNPAPFRRIPAEVLAGVDILVPNAGELADLLGGRALDPEPETADQAIDLLRRHGLPTPCVIVTLGAEGALIARASLVDADDDADPEFVTVPAPKVEVVDTVGAGDVFCGALADALARDVDLIGAVRWATHAAALAVTQPGAQGGQPSAADVAALLARTPHENP